MAFKKAITLKNGLVTTYHRVWMEPLPTGRTKCRIHIQSWSDSDSRRARPSEPIQHLQLDAISKVKRTVADPITGQTREEEQEVEFDFFQQLVPVGSTTFADGFAKVAYQLMKSNGDLFAGAEDV